MNEIIKVIIKLLDFIFGLNSNTNTTKMKSSKDIELFNKYYSDLKRVIFGNGYIITPAVGLALLKKESYYRSLSEPNSNIIGDNWLKNKAYGYLQIRMPALKDFNQYYGKHYTIDDIKNDYISNFVVGLGYFNMLYLTALNNKIDKPLEQTFTRYNSGKYGSSEYATITFKYYTIFKDFT